MKFSDLPRPVRWATYLFVPGILIHELAHVAVAFLLGFEVGVDLSVPVVRFNVTADTSAPEFVSVMLAPVPVAVVASGVFVVFTPELTALTFAWAVLNLTAVGNVIEDTRIIVKSLA